MKAIQKLKLTNLPSLLTSKEVAWLLCVEVITLLRWTRSGAIKGYKLDKREWRYKREDVLAFMKMEKIA